MNLNVLKQSKQIHVYQDFYEQILNGFQTQQQKQQIDVAKSSIVFHSRQGNYFQRLTTPIIMKQFDKTKLLQDVVITMSQRASDAKFESLKMAFAKAKSQIQEQSSQQIEEVQEKEKGGVLGKMVTIARAYRKIQSMVFVIKTMVGFGRQVKELFAKGSEEDYSEKWGKENFQESFYNMLHQTQQPLINTLSQVLYPIFHKLNRVIDEKFDNLTGKFWWWLVKTVLLPDTSDPLDVVLWSLSVVGGILTAGASFLAGMSVRILGIAAKIISIGKKVSGLLRVTSKISKLRGIWKVGSTARKAIQVAAGVHVLATLARTSRIGKTLFTGIDLYYTSESDVEDMTKAYTEWSTKIGEKAQRRINRRLRGIGQDLSFVDAALRSATSNLRDSMLTITGSGGLFRRMQRLYNCKISVDIQGDSFKRYTTVMTQLNRRINNRYSRRSEVNVGGWIRTFEVGQDMSTITVNNANKDNDLLRKAFAENNAKSYGTFKFSKGNSVQIIMEMQNLLSAQIQVYQPVRDENGRLTFSDYYHRLQLRKVRKKISFDKLMYYQGFGITLSDSKRQFYKTKQQSYGLGSDEQIVQRLARDNVSLHTPNGVINFPMEVSHLGTVSTDDQFYRRLDERMQSLGWHTETKEVGRDSQGNVITQSKYWYQVQYEDGTVERQYVDGIRYSHARNSEQLKLERQYQQNMAQQFFRHSPEILLEPPQLSSYNQYNRRNKKQLKSEYKFRRISGAPTELGFKLHEWDSYYDVSQEDRAKLRQLNDAWYSNTSGFFTHKKFLFSQIKNGSRQTKQVNESHPSVPKLLEKLLLYNMKWYYKHTYNELNPESKSSTPVTEYVWDTQLKIQNIQKQTLKHQKDFNKELEKIKEVIIEKLK